MSKEVNLVYTSLKAGETEHTASLCKCRLVRNEKLNRVDLIMCLMHRALPILREALVQYVEYWDALQDIDEDDKRMLEDAKKAMRMSGMDT